MTDHDIDLESVDDTEFADEEDANLIYKEMERLKAQYTKVAVYFGVPPDILDEIRENNPKNSASAFNDVIKSWVRQEHNVGKFGYPSWRKVVEAAVGAGNKLQAKKIARNHPVGSTRSEKSKTGAISPLPTLLQPGKIIEFNVLDKTTVEIDGGGGMKLLPDLFKALKIDQDKSQPIRLTSGPVHPKEGTKSSAVAKYTMTSKPHGIALIINNEKFTAHRHREGTAIDERNLLQTFRFLSYNVEVYRNVESRKMRAIMTEMGRRDHTKYDSFVCCILSHGKEGQVYGTDSVMVPLDDLASKIDANTCPSLGGKPKLFFLQACRGKLKEDSVRVDTDAGDNVPTQEPTRVATDEGTRVATDSDVQIPILADFFFGYATPLGFVAWRDLDNGSWYISELCKALCELSACASLDEIMTRVRHEVGRAYHNDGYRMSPETTTRLQKSVYFK